ncbi:MAG TPA: SDR family NAD(P)-dependent oxidoreductase [Solirubrobacterales bacterium]|nr:SDR family NAD(P)-dependent oxidoreductase [Solirubrobacterales bacterium]
MKRAALVVGGGTGVGAATARRLAADGVAVTIAGRRREPLEAVAGEIRAAGGEIEPIPADLGEEASVRSLVEQTVERLGGIDTVVAAAGILEDADEVPKLTLETWQRYLDVNLTGVFLLARESLPHLVRRRGSIVTVGSVSSVVGGPISAPYCATKAGVMMLTQCLAVDHAPQGVRANCVLPGWIETDMGDAEMDWIAGREGISRQEAYELANENVPMKRAARPEEVAEVIAFLAGPTASYVTGAAVPVDGGSLAVWAGVATYMPKG